MAKTIKDMATERYDFHKSTNPKNKPLVMRGFFAYQEGANVALDELKKRLQKYKMEPMGEYFVAWDYINEIINELKGE